LTQEFISTGLLEIVEIRELYSNTKMNSTSIRWNFQPAESDWESCFREFM